MSVSNPAPHLLGTTREPDMQVILICASGPYISLRAPASLAAEMHRLAGCEVGINGREYRIAAVTISGLKD